MFNKPLQQPTNVAPGAVAILRVQPEEFTLVGLKLSLSGTTFDKTKIDRVRIKVGPRVIWDLLGSQIDKINNYKAGADNSKILLLDFTERAQALFPVKELGGLDLMTLVALGEVFVEIYINATAVAPAIDVTGYYEMRQGNPVLLKFVPFSFTQSASGKFTLPLNMRGALIKRVWLFYTGTNFTGTTNGNVSRVEVKKNGVVMYDQTCLANRFDASNFKKVPQANTFVVDFIVDDNHDAHVSTIRNSQSGQVYDAFEFNAYLTDAGGASVTAVAEVLDTPTNL